MKSLRVRLLATVMVAVVVFWASWGAFLGIGLWREQRGWRDSMLESAAQLLLLSLPDAIDRLPAANAQAVVPNTAYGKYDVAFQVWVDGRNVMHSADAPRTTRPGGSTRCRIRRAGFTFRPAARPRPGRRRRTTRCNSACSIRR